MITLIAAIGRNNEIGFENKLLWKIPEDMRHFKDYTAGKIVVMGRKTFSSIGKVLPGRKCIVLTTSDLHGASITAKNIDDILSIEHCYPELVIIGGEQIYNQFIKFADKLVITHVDAEFEADAFFPKIDKKIWNPTNIQNSQNQDYNYTFIEYFRN